MVGDGGCFLKESGFCDESCGQAVLRLLKIFRGFVIYLVANMNVWIFLQTAWQ
jgi:hypothetical protein